MIRRMAFVVILIACVCVAAAGCHRGIDRTARVSPSSADALIAHDVPVVGYDSKVSIPLPIRQNLLAEAEVSRPANRSAWFLSVMQTYGSHESCTYRAVVYFTPDRITPRVRTGRCAVMSGVFNQNTGLPVGNWSRSRSRPTVGEYIQISRLGDPFGDVLDLPDQTLHPLMMPPDLTRDDVIELVDLVRSDLPTETEIRQAQDETGRVEQEDAPELRQLGRQIAELNIRAFRRRGSLATRTDEEKRVLFITRNGDEADVYTGRQSAPLAGGGWCLRCRKFDGHWISVAWSQWVS